MTQNFTQLIEKAATLPAAIQEKIALQWLDNVDNELQWQTTLEQPTPIREFGFSCIAGSQAGKNPKNRF